MGQLVPAGVVIEDGEVSGAQTFGGVLDAAYAAGQTAIDEQDDEADDDEGHGGDDDKKEREVVDTGPYLAHGKGDGEEEARPGGCEERLGLPAAVGVRLRARLPANHPLRHRLEVLGDPGVGEHVDPQDILWARAGEDQTAFQQKEPIPLVEHLNVVHELVKFLQKNVAAHDAQQLAAVVVNGRGQREDHILGLLVEIGIGEHDLPPVLDGLSVPVPGSSVEALRLLPGAGVRYPSRGLQAEINRPESMRLTNVEKSL